MPLANGSADGRRVNRGSYSFASPNPVRDNTSVVENGFHARTTSTGSSSAETFRKTRSMKLNSSQGRVASIDTVQQQRHHRRRYLDIPPNLINDVRYGYVRQGFSNTGVATGDFVDFRFMSTAAAETRTSITSVPVNNLVDNLSWTKGKHSLQFGGNWRFIHQNHVSDNSTWQGASSNPYWLGGNPPQPADPVSDGFANSYQIAFANLVEPSPSLTNSYNYHVDSATSGTLLPDGAFLNRHFKANEFEGYVQDAWRVRPNLTIAFGVRQTILQTPYETSGQQVSTDHRYARVVPAKRSCGSTRPGLGRGFQFSPAGPYYGSRASGRSRKTTSPRVWP